MWLLGVVARNFHAERARHAGRLLHGSRLVYRIA